MKRALHIVCILLALPFWGSARQYVDLTDSTISADSIRWEQHRKTRSIACCYPSVDQNGQPIMLSGRLFVPREGQAERVILCPHYTITANSECPSEGHAFEARLAQKNCILLMPDYLGYGITADRTHPYLDVHLTVRNTLDMLRAAESFIRSQQLTPRSDSILIVGFSQGAAVAIGALEQIERTQLCPVKHCYASSGPYDVAATYDLCVERDYVGMAFVVPAFVMGTNEAYGLHIHPDTIFTPWMLKRYEYALSKKHGVIATALRLGHGKLSKYLSPAGLDKTKGEQKQLYEGYLRSSLVHIYGTDTLLGNWCPTTPLYLMHSTNDDLVNFECAEHLRTQFERAASCPSSPQPAIVTSPQPAIVYDFGKYGGHIASLLRFFRYLDKELIR